MTIPKTGDGSPICRMTRPGFLGPDVGAGRAHAAAIQQRIETG
jgi:hypothetical protein